MGKGHEDLHRLHTALAAFEEAIVQREHRKALSSKVTHQQEVDRAREHVVTEVVKMVTEARVGSGTKGG